MCLTYAQPGEHAFARPCVVKDGGLYRMWYAVRGERYRLGYAESADGLDWERKDARAGPRARGGRLRLRDALLSLRVRRGGTRYLLYNGNDYGRTGIGLAVEVLP